MAGGAGRNDDVIAAALTAMAQAQGNGGCNSPIFRYFYLFNMCLYMFVCDYLSLGVFSWVFLL